MGSIKTIQAAMGYTSGGSQDPNRTCMNCRHVEKPRMGKMFFRCTKGDFIVGSFAACKEYQEQEKVG